MRDTYKLNIKSFTINTNNANNINNKRNNAKYTKPTVSFSELSCRGASVLPAAAGLYQAVLDWPPQWAGTGLMNARSGSGSGSQAGQGAGSSSEGGHGRRRVRPL